MASVYEIITDRICKKVEQVGHLPWQRPWRRNEEMPRNLERPDTPYKGINFWILLAEDRKSPYWVTLNYVKKCGGKIKTEEMGKGTYIVFWKFIEGKDGDGEPNGNRIPFLRYYKVWNVEQTEGLEHKIPKNKTEEKPLDFNPLEECEKILKEMPQPREMIQHGGNRASYNYVTDKIKMPDQTDFASVEEYYSTLFHELVHSTGHENRVNRKGAFGVGFGRENYSKEELVAEIGSCFLCSTTGIENKTIDNSAAYLGSWLKRLRNDPKMLVLAASAAQKATDYMLNN